MFDIKDLPAELLMKLCKNPRALSKVTRLPIITCYIKSKVAYM